MEDLARFPDDGNRYELLDGVLLVTPAPTHRHQIVANQLQWRISPALEPTGIAHVVGSGEIASPPRTQLQPDVLAYPARFSPTIEWQKIDEHWLAVEALSRSSRVYDRVFRRDSYFALRVREVWLADCDAGLVEVCRERGIGETVSDVLRWSVPSAGMIVTIDLGDVFAGLE